MKYFIYDLEIISLKNLSELQEFALKHNIFLPDEGTCFVAKNDDGEIVGLLNAREIIMIEPMISTNPIVSWKLFNLFLERYSGKVIRAITLPKNLELLKKLNFNQEFEDLIIVERIPQWQDHLKENRQ